MELFSVENRHFASRFIFISFSSLFYLLTSAFLDINTCVHQIDRKLLNQPSSRFIYSLFNETSSGSEHTTVNNKLGRM